MEITSPCSWRCAGSVRGTSKARFWAVPISIEARSLAWLGRNGVGKSTLVMTLMGLVQATAGSVRLNGVELSGCPAHEMARAGVALVPQGRRIWPRLTVQNTPGSHRARTALALALSALDPRGRPRAAATARRAPSATRGATLGRRAADARHRAGSALPARATLARRLPKGSRARDRPLRHPAVSPRSSDGSATLGCRFGAPQDSMP